MHSAALVGVLLLGHAGVAAGASPAPPASASPDLELILQEARRVQFADTAAWSRFRFRRQVQRERFGAAGEALEEQELEFVLTPTDDGFDEEIVLVDGREATPAEVRDHRRQQRFTRHYAAARSGTGGAGEEGGYSLGLLLRLSSYLYVGQEEVDGVPCHRIDFSPSEGRKPRGLEERLAQAMAGSLWITVEGHHIARAEARTLRPVSAALSFARVHDLEVSLEASPVWRGIWLPRRIEVRAEARVTWVPIRRRTTYNYSGFHLARESAEDEVQLAAPALATSAH